MLPVLLWDPSEDKPGWVAQLCVLGQFLGEGAGHSQVVLRCLIYYKSHKGSAGLLSVEDEPGTHGLLSTSSLSSPLQSAQTLNKGQAWQDTL